MDKDNPAAFARPISHDGDDGRAEVFLAQEGMSLRDYFAGQAIIGIMSTSGAFQRADRREDMVAHKAYEFADAMLAARKVNTQ